MSGDIQVTTQGLALLNVNPTGTSETSFVDVTSRDVRRAESSRRKTMLGALVSTYKWRMLFTYGLFNVENLLRLSQPYMLGLAINGLLASSYLCLGLFAVQHFTHMLIGCLRRMYDTRAFTGIYTDLAARLVTEQRAQQVETSRVAARSALSREYVSFFEHDVPLMFHGLYSVLGALVVFAWYDGLIALTCIGLVIPASLLNWLYGRKTLRLHKRLNDQFESEVDVIKQGERQAVRKHYGLLRRWQIKLSDWEAMNFGAMEFLIVGLMATSLIRLCGAPETSAGDIFAVFRYVMMFVLGLDCAPVLVQQISRLRDIGRRMRVDDTAGNRILKTA